MKKFILLLVAASFLAGCNAKEAVTVTSELPQGDKPAAGALAVADPDTVATLSGAVRFEGDVPVPKQLSVRGNPECAALHEGGMIPSEELIVKDGFLQNVFVYVKQGLETYAFPMPSGPVTIENKKCVYVPHVSGAMAGQEIIFLNQDSTLHNIHSYPKNGKAFNLGLPLVGMKQVKKIEMPEVMIPLKCDVHPWMQGYLGVLAHPFFGVTGESGTFELKGLPPGTYEIEAWHEKLGAQTQTVTLGPRETKEISFTFKS